MRLAPRVSRGEDTVASVLRDGAELTADELIGYCRERMARFKVPDSVEFAGSLPRTAVGKIHKHLLRPPAAAESAHERRDPQGPLR
jgi:acyl-CoA synthetase (AMP-forming)/AMP-acid ligase II